MQYPDAYSQGFFAVQIAFARRVGAITGLSLPDAALRYTALYRVLGLDWTFDAQHPIWRQASKALAADDPAAAVYQLYRSRLAEIPRFSELRHWGCFAFEYDAEARAIRLHFANADAGPTWGPLSASRREARMGELRAMFAHVKQMHPDVETVLGGSWLYNLDSYLRLFPPDFGASATPDEPHYRARGLWGQFLRHDWAVHPGRAASFLRRLEEAHSLDDLPACFPYQVLLTQAPIGEFSTFYGV